MKKEQRVIPCPIPEYDDINEDGRPKYYVTLPPKWLGEHAIIREEAIRKGDEKELPSLFLTFAVSLAIADDFNLPGLTGKQENWDFSQLDLELITWVNWAVYGSFDRDFTVKKNYLLASLNGHVTNMRAALGETGAM